MADEESQLLSPGLVEERKVLKQFAFVVPYFLGVAIPMIVIGHLYLADCRVEPFIPIFVMVAGYGLVLWNAFYVGMSCCRIYSSECMHKALRFCFVLMANLLFAWHIAGSVWVYSVEKVEFEDVTSEEYCNKTLYYISYWFLSMVWSLGGFLIGIAIANACC